MNKQEYINKWMEELNDSFLQDKSYKLVLPKFKKEELTKCLKCEHDKFYMFNGFLICSNCFTEYNINKDNCYLANIEDNC